MKAKLVLLFLIFQLAHSFAQVEDRVVLFDRCDSSFVECLPWSLMDENELYAPDILENEFYVNVSPGIYTLRCGFEYFGEVEVKNTKSQIDTFYSTKLYWFQAVGAGFYSFCGDYANGTLSDTFKNGQLRASGTFKNGVAIDTFYEYYRNGHLETIAIPDTVRKGGSYYACFYPNGQLERSSDNKKRRYESYYESGQIEHKSKSFSIGNRTKTYYENGVLESKEFWIIKKIYGENGLIKNRLFIRVFKANFVKGKDPLVYQSWKMFDSLGNIELKVKFRKTRYFFNWEFAFQLDEISDFLIDEVIIWKNGKRAFKLREDYKKIDGVYKQVVSVYKKQGLRWVLVEQKPLKEIHGLIEYYLSV